MILKTNAVHPVVGAVRRALSVLAPDSAGRKASFTLDAFLASRISTFQAEQGLPATGEIDDATLRSLFPKGQPQ